MGRQKDIDRYVDQKCEVLWFRRYFSNTELDRILEQVHSHEISEEVGVSRWLRTYHEEVLRVNLWTCDVMRRILSLLDRVEYIRQPPSQEKQESTRTRAFSGIEAAIIAQRQAQRQIEMQHSQSLANMNLMSIESLSDEEVLLIRGIARGINRLQHFIDLCSIIILNSIDKARLEFSDEALEQLPKPRDVLDLPFVSCTRVQEAQVRLNLITQCHSSDSRVQEALKSAMSPDPGPLPAPHWLANGNTQSSGKLGYSLLLQNRPRTACLEPLHISDAVTDLAKLHRPTSLISMARSAAALEGQVVGRRVLIHSFLIGGMLGLLLPLILLTSVIVFPRMSDNPSVFRLPGFAYIFYPFFFCVVSSGWALGKAVNVLCWRKSRVDFLALLDQRLAQATLPVDAVRMALFYLCFIFLAAVLGLGGLTGVELLDLHVISHVSPMTVFIIGTLLAASVVSIPFSHQRRSNAIWVLRSTARVFTFKEPQLADFIILGTLASIPHVLHGFGMTICSEAVGGYNDFTLSQPPAEVCQRPVSGALWLIASGLPQILILITSIHGLVLASHRCDRALRRRRRLHHFLNVVESSLFIVGSVLMSAVSLSSDPSSQLQLRVAAQTFNGIACVCAALFAFQTTFVVVDASQERGRIKLRVDAITQRPAVLCVLAILNALLHVVRFISLYPLPEYLPQQLQNNGGGFLILACATAEAFRVSLWETFRVEIENSLCVSTAEPLETYSVAALPTSITTSTDLFVCDC